MSDTLSVIEKHVAEGLIQIGLDIDKIEISELSDSHSAFFVRIVSRAFEGLTFLDREMRVRPAVAKAFFSAGFPRAEFIVEPLDLDEIALEESALAIRPSSDEDASDVSGDAAQGRAAWRENLAQIVNALRDSAYEVEILIPDQLYKAERSIMAREVLLVGFAKSLSAKTIDFEIRKAIEVARKAETYSAIYYVSPRPLTAPFANQTKVKWLYCITATVFMHQLNSSAKLSKRLVQEIADIQKNTALEHQGPVIDPVVKEFPSGIEHGRFQDFIKDWGNTAGPSLLVVMAPAGHGKTTLCQELSRKLALRFSNDGPPHPVPLLVPFESVRRVVDFESLLARRLNELHAGPTGAFLPLLHRGEAVLVVDGFDELANDAGFDVAENQVRSMKFLFSGRARVVLAGRSLFTEEFAESGSTGIKERMKSLLGPIQVDVIEVLPFDDDDIKLYLESRSSLTESQRSLVLNFVRKSLDQRNLASNPLLLKVLCSLASSDELVDSLNIGVTGVERLIAQVCVREETRQHLGIGIEKQIEFLRLIAVEAFSARRGLTREDLRLWADALLHGDQITDNILGKLADHALLVRRTADRIDFIHPYLRDILIGESIHSEITKQVYGDIEKFDLPEVSIQHLASVTTFADFPAQWLSDTTLIKKRSMRRNFLRIALAQASTRGERTDWIPSSWMRDRMIQSIDFSRLRLNYWSFDDVNFVDCDLSDAIMEECDFRGTSLTRCDLTNSQFVDCRSDENTRALACTFRSTTSRNQRGRNAVVAIENDLDFAGALRMESKPHLQPKIDRIPQHVTARVFELIKGYVAQLAHAEPAARFFTLHTSELRNIGVSDREKQVFDRVLDPGIRSAICLIGTSAGSQEVISLDKRYHALVVEFLRSGIPPRPLTERLGSIARRAGRMLAD